ncbi:hypothetical protein BDV36DRAFT_269399 [Aspergillus pseudocaelatus]|uniref:Uncharacterized protein n=1 Tax=Aspergillus pseudocaelatus TaxID=1825620 RepID=A0ABQ6W7M2_9EURO|nr:hypothetical protein BDV36DRAFT_269399 [Aspergillus pseudocaelatus]
MLGSGVQGTTLAPYEEAQGRCCEKCQHFPTYSMHTINVDMARDLDRCFDAPYCCLIKKQYPGRILGNCDASKVPRKALSQ